MKENWYNIISTVIPTALILAFCYWLIYHIIIQLIIWLTPFEYVFSKQREITIYSILLIVLFSILYFLSTAYKDTN